jgi:hypothetical protein
VKVTLGATDRCRVDITSVNDSVSGITVLPNYDARTGSHDIALLKLTNPVTFNQNINPICLPEPSKMQTHLLLLLLLLLLLIIIIIIIIINKLRGLSPRENYTHRATAACRRS